MKKTKTKRPVRHQTASHKAKTAIKQARPLHKRFLLHPFTVMVLLCAGVLIVGMTIRAVAATVTISAKVSAGLPTQPASIDSPTDSLHVSTSIQTVSGTCPALTYVSTTVNSVFSGSAPCTSGQYSMPVTLADGANSLGVQDYNFTDDAGPPTAPITVYYDHVVVNPPSPPPSNLPTTLELVGVENNTFSPTSAVTTVLKTSDNPTISGLAPPFSHITIVFHSVVTSCETVANSQGVWSCTLDHALPAGVHHVDISATAPGGKVFTIPTFSINVLTGLGNLLVPATSSAPRLSVDRAFEARSPGQATSWVMSIVGGTAPYTVNVDWGDNSGYRQVYSSDAAFTLVHSFHSPQTYLVSVTITDAHGGLSVTQLVASVNPAAVNAATVIKGGSTLSQLYSGGKSMLWLIWPAYTVVVLMVIGYYLGEREEYRLLMARKLAPARAGGRTRRR